MRILDIVPNTQVTSVACFIMALYRGITKIRRYFIYCVLLHSSCIVTDVLKNGCVLLNTLCMVNCNIMRTNFTEADLKLLFQKSTFSLKASLHGHHSHLIRPRPYWLIFRIGMMM